ncbi:MAG: tetratricopeptide repeat protein [Candidatus Microthrix sp.]|nr:tetratricopeptide repeat protein [Candidatus Microthrix sp.]
MKADDDAASRFLELLELLDPDSPATGEWRRKLSARLF